MLSSKRPSPAPEGELRASLNKGQRFATTFCDLEKPHRLRHCQSPRRGRNALASLPPHGSDALSRGLHGISPALPYHDPPLAPNARITFKTASTLCVCCSPPSWTSAAEQFAPTGQEPLRSPGAPARSARAAAPSTRYPCPITRAGRPQRSMSVCIFRPFHSTARTALCAAAGLFLQNLRFPLSD